MTSHHITQADRLDALPPGMLEYQTRTSIRDLIRLYGFEGARELVAQILNDEAERKPRQ